MTTTPRLPATCTACGQPGHGADDPDCPRKPPPVQYPRKRGKDCPHCGLPMILDRDEANPGREYWTCGCGAQRGA